MLSGSSVKMCQRKYVWRSLWNGRMCYVEKTLVSDVCCEHSFESLRVIEDWRKDFEFGILGSTCTEMESVREVSCFWIL